LFGEGSGAAVRYENGLFFADLIFVNTLLALLADYSSSSLGEVFHGKHS
jgi:hypothetical protein